MVAAVRHPPVQPVTPAPSFCGNMKDLAVIVVQTAIRVLFIVGSILMVAAALPLQFHAVAIPLVAFSSTLLAGFFFPKPIEMAPVRPAQGQPLIRPARAQAAPPVAAPAVISESPRGLMNTGNNCAFNSLVHFFESEPRLAHWLRHPIHEGMDRAAFEQFLRGYAPPQTFIDAFRTYVAAQAPGLSVPLMFWNFCHTHAPDPAYVEFFHNMKETYDKLLKFQATFADFLAAYDQAMQENRPLVAADSQTLRRALHEVAPWINPFSEQLEIGDPMGVIFNCLPDSFKMYMSETYRYDTRGLPPLDGIPDGITEKNERHVQIALNFTENDPAPHLERMLQRFCDDPMVLKKKSIHGRNENYPTTVTRKFLEAPPALRFQIKRYVAKEDLPPSWLTKLGIGWLWPKGEHRMDKIKTPVEVPHEITITLANEERKTYRLNSFVNHFGPYGGGHYVACRLINGRRYYMSDQNVTLTPGYTPQDERWDEAHAYFLHYEPV